MAGVGTAMGEKAADSWDRATALAFQHLNTVFGVGLGEHLGLLPDAPRDSLLFVSVAKEVLASSSESGSSSAEAQEYLRALSALHRANQGAPLRTGSHNVDHISQPAKVDELLNWVDSAYSLSALDALSERVKHPDKWRTEGRERASNAGPAAKAPGTGITANGAGTFDKDGQQDGHLGDLGILSGTQRRVRRRKAVEYEEEEDTLNNKGKKSSQPTAVKEGAVNGSLKGTLQSSKDTSPAKHGVVKKPVAKPSGAAGPSDAPKVHRRDDSVPNRQPEERRSGWAPLFGSSKASTLKGKEDELLDTAKHQGGASEISPPPYASRHTPSFHECFSCGGGPVLGFLVSCLGGCGKVFHNSCPGLSKPSLNEATSQRCKDCLAKYKRAVQEALESAEEKIGSYEAANGEDDALYAPSGRRRKGPAPTSQEGEGSKGPSTANGADAARVLSPREDRSDMDEIENDEDEDSREFSPLGDTLKRRRKKVAYTEAEDKALQRGMEKYKDESDKWKRILVFGRGVFQDRDPVSLKDRWRNLQKLGRR